MATSLCAHLFYGFVWDAPPWRGAADFRDGESAEERLRRRLAELGFGPERLAACELGRAHEAGRPWWLFARASYRSAGDTASEELPGFAVDPAWPGELRRFAEVLGIPWREPSWCLATEQV